MNEPRLPRNVKILGRKYRVKECSEPIIVDGEESSGACYTVDQIIEIEKALPMDEKMGILAHEMGHAGLVITGLDQKFTEKEIEVFCQLMRALVEDYVRAFK